MYITNVILNINICLSIQSLASSNLWSQSIYAFVYFSNVFHFILTINQKFKIEFTERIFLAMNFILTSAQKAIKMCSVIDGKTWNFS